MSPPLDATLAPITGIAACCANGMDRCRLLEVVAQLLAARWVAELPQGLRLDLADALARDHELTAHFLEGAAAAIVQAEAQLEHLSLAHSQAVQDVHHLLFQQLM